MTTSIRLPYSDPLEGKSPAGRLPYLPVTLTHRDQTVTVSGLLDTGSMVNVLPYAVGLQLGLVWDEYTTPVRLTGNLADLPARAVVVSGQVESFPKVALAFAWSRSTDVPVILGQINFFMEFDICFFGSRSVFEIKPTEAS